MPSAVLLGYGRGSVRVQVTQFPGVQASRVIRSDSSGFPGRPLLMATSRFALSPLPPLAAFLVQRAQSNDQLQAALDDGLADYEEGTQVIMTALRALLDEWLSEGSETLYNTNQFTEPYLWLAISDQLEVVQTFRNLLGED